MFCEGDKTFSENVGCPVCGMDLVKITGNDDESEDDTYKNLQKKTFGFRLLLRLPVFILSMGGMFFEFPFSSKISGILQLIFTLPVVFFTGWFLFKRAWISFKTWNLNMFSLDWFGSKCSFRLQHFRIVFSEFNSS